MITFEGESADRLGCGEICLVSVDAAERFARENKRSFSEELTLYLAHGAGSILAGHDDLFADSKAANAPGRKKGASDPSRSGGPPGFWPESGAMTSAGSRLAPAKLLVSENASRDLFRPARLPARHRPQRFFFGRPPHWHPLVVTVWAFSRIIELVGGTFRPVFFFYLPEAVRDRPSLDVVWDMLATFIVIVLVTLLGYVSRDVFVPILRPRRRALHAEHTRSRGCLRLGEADRGHVQHQERATCSTRWSWWRFPPERNLEPWDS